MYGFYPSYCDDDEEPDTQREGFMAIEKPKPKYDPEYKCIRCGDWHKDVHPNQEDGTFKCYLCRQNSYR